MMRLFVLVCFIALLSLASIALYECHLCSMILHFIQIEIFCFPVLYWFLTSLVLSVLILHAPFLPLLLAVCLFLRSDQITCLRRKMFGWLVWHSLVVFTENFHVGNLIRAINVLEHKGPNELPHFWVLVANNGAHLGEPTLGGKEGENHKIRQLWISTYIV